MTIVPRPMKTLFATLLTVVAVTGASAQDVDYRFDEVKRNVRRQGAPVEKGQHARGGDKVSTGWFSYASISSEGHRATFELFSATDVTLAEGTPGVLLSLERGRIRAAFDKITGSEPRIVKTPGALLAVRGTDFHVRVDGSGNTLVDVFEGVVEIRSPLQQEPQLVRAGEESSFGPRRPPQTRPMPEDRRREGMRQRDGDRQGPNDGSRGKPQGPPKRGGEGAGAQPPSSHPPSQPPGSHATGSHPSPPPPPPPPPPRPPVI